MILFRYFAREVLSATFATLGILLVIALAWRFGGYLEQAAAGSLDKEILAALIFYRLPGFLELTLPVSFFLAVILAYGRLHVDNEMIVLHACGLSVARVTAMTLALALPVMAAAASVSLWIKPLGERQVEALLAGQARLTEFDTLGPGRFQVQGGGRRVTYVEAIPEQGRLAGVFINAYQGEEAGDGPMDTVTLMARRGFTQVDSAGRRRLVMQDGLRYSGRPGQGRYQVVRYAEYGRFIEGQDGRGAARVRPRALATAALLGDGSAEALAEFHWRLAMALLTPVLALLAVPLAKVEPRQGRGARLLPALALCFAYLLALSAARSALEKGSLPLALGLWWLHGLFLLLAASLYRFEGLSRGLAASFSR